jgi:hypothetical protein
MNENEKAEEVVGPRPTGKSETFNITGWLFAVYESRALGDGSVAISPVLLRLDGSKNEYLPVYPEVHALRTAMAVIGLHEAVDYQIKQVTDQVQFLSEMPRKNENGDPIVVAANMRYDKTKGKTVFAQLVRN